VTLSTDLKNAYRIGYATGLREIAAKLNEQSARLVALSTAGATDTETEESE
jgi:hypothetical protein